MRRLNNQIAPLLPYTFLTQTKALLRPLSGALVHVTKCGTQLNLCVRQRVARQKRRLPHSANSEKHRTVFICFVDFCWMYSPFFQLTQPSLDTSLAEGMGERG